MLDQINCVYVCVYPLLTLAITFQVGNCWWKFEQV